jgi:hypothetical protein
MLAALRRARVVAAVGAVGLAVSVAPAAAAHAGTPAGAEQRAKALLAKVQQLEAKVKAAETAYDRSLAAVARSVTAASLTDRASETVAAQTADAADGVAARVRGLYMSGGPLAVYATLLQSGDINEFQDRNAIVSSLVNADQSVVTADQHVAAVVRARAAKADRAARNGIKTERSVAQAATHVLRLLAAEQALLDRANAEVAHLKDLAAARAALAAQTTAFSSITTARTNALGILPPPTPYLSLYHRAAATCPGMSWTVLAAIGQVESGHGRDPSTSSAGAMGPMQFLPSTFATYAVDGDGDGKADIMNPADAIFTAGRYLCANGAGRGGSAVANAVWHYNHADWYVQMVLALARKYVGYTG